MTKTVTRYRMEGRLVKCAPGDSEPYFADVEEVEALNGEWVKWEDVKPLLRAVEPAEQRHVAINPATCPCPGHPFHCYGHPVQCGCNAKPCASENRTSAHE